VLLGMKHGIRAMLRRRLDRQLVLHRRAQRGTGHERVLGGQGRRHRRDQGGRR
jgi:hypothetical protein